MSHSHAHILGAVSSLIPPIQDEEDDDEDDDICPVCESECTCRHKPGVSDVATSAIAPSTPSTSTFDGSPQEHPSLPSLKIKITVPPKLKGQSIHNASAAHAAPSPSPPTRSSGQFAANQSHIEPASYHVAPPPKRRGRPPKAAVAVREAAKAAALANSNGFGTARRNKPAAVNKKSSQKTSSIHSSSTGLGNSAAAQTLATLSGDEDDDIVSGIYPTFMSAVSSLSHSSSSDSSSELDSDELAGTSDPEMSNHSFSLRAPKTHGRMNHGDDINRKRRDHLPNNNWEIRPRKKSVDGDSDLESADTSDVDEDGYIEDQENAGEGDDDEDDEDEDDAEADVEGGGLDFPEMDEDDANSRIGISFDGVPSGWSDDEESSFDADLFFANLDDTSDDSSSTSPQLQDEENSDIESDVDLTSMSSIDEDGTVFFMDIERLLQLQRDGADFELDLRNLSFEWDGLVLADPGLSVDLEMQSDGESTCTEVGNVTDEAMFEDEDGDTTEDELVDSDGLPNSRAMMLFQWPSVVSAINPLSTVGHVSDFQGTQAHGSQTVRIALASMSARRDAPCPSPADILSGRFTTEDIDDPDSDKSQSPTTRNTSKQRSGPIMGEFNHANPEGEDRCVIIDGKGGDIPSPWPRRQRKTKPVAQRLGELTELNSDQVCPCDVLALLSACTYVFDSGDFHCTCSVSISTSSSHVYIAFSRRRCDC